MGTLRLLLSLAIVAAHTGPIFGLWFTGGIVAVEMFFIISGFSIALVLDRKYQGAKAYRRFLFSRFLRLLPVYWVALIAAILVSALSGLFRGDWMFLAPFIWHAGDLGLFAWFYVSISNIALLGMDLGYFLHITSSGGLAWTANYKAYSPCLEIFNPVAQAWVISLLFMFYILAPWFVRWRSLILAGLALIIYACRIALYVIGDMQFDPWTYRAFPLELPMFVGGILSYRWALPIVRRHRDKVPGLMTVFAIGYLCWTLFYQFVPGGAAKHLAYYGFSLLALPVLLELCRGGAADRYIGELAFPVFLVHILVGRSIQPFLKLFELDVWSGPVTAFVSILVGVLLVRYVIQPVDQWRYHITGTNRNELQERDSS